MQRTRGEALRHGSSIGYVARRLKTDRLAALENRQGWMGGRLKLNYGAKSRNCQVRVRRNLIREPVGAYVGFEVADPVGAYDGFEMLWGREVIA
jgi:hypothetical protein